MRYLDTSGVVTRLNVCNFYVAGLGRSGLGVERRVNVAVTGAVDVKVVGAAEPRCQVGSTEPALDGDLLAQYLLSSTFHDSGDHQVLKLPWSLKFVLGDSGLSFEEVWSVKGMHIQSSEAETRAIDGREELTASRCRGSR